MYDILKKINMFEKRNVFVIVEILYIYREQSLDVEKQKAVDVYKKI